jgi:hypothetical protein
MKAIDYKKQFVEFMRLVWPEGTDARKRVLNSSKVGILMQFDDVRYEFNVDPNDLHQSPKSKKTIDLDNPFTPNDIEWLKTMKVRVSDGEED